MDKIRKIIMSFFGVKNSERILVFPKVTIVKFDGLPCLLLVDTPYECETIRVRPEEPSSNVELICNNCGKILPPMEPGEGEPCEIGYLCRKCNYETRNNGQWRYTI